MNERFFELKKDRQDRIINGAMRIFTENGYRHASTDEMVAAASISKGLLFHYFKSKKGTFQFLYEYGTRYMLMELREAERRQGCDFFEMFRLLSRADAAVLHKYPCLTLFLKRADLEMEESGAGLPDEITGAIAAKRLALISSAVKPPFLSPEDTRRLVEMLEYTREGLMRELLGKAQSGTSGKKQAEEPEAEPQALHEEYAARFAQYLYTMRKLNM